MRSFSISAVSTYHECSLKFALLRWGAEPEWKALSLVIGICVHAATAFTLKGMRAGRTPTEEEALELLSAEFLLQECSSEIKYGGAKRDAVVAQMQALYRLWRSEWKVPAGGEILEVEEPLQVSFPGIPLPMNGIPDCVIRTEKGVEIFDWKVSGRRPSYDDLFDGTSPAKVAYSRGWELLRNERVVSFTKVHLLKLKEPVVHMDAQPVRAEDRDLELKRFALTIAPALEHMQAILSGAMQPSPTTSFLRACGACPVRRSCWAYQGRPPESLAPTPQAAAGPPAAAERP